MAPGREEAASPSTLPPPPMPVSRQTSRLCTGLLAALLGGTACQHVPEVEDFDHYEASFREQARPEFEQLAAERAEGRISEAEYALGIRQLEDGITARAHEAIYNHTRLINDQKPGESLFAGGGVPGGVRGSRGGGRGGGGVR